MRGTWGSQPTRKQARTAIVTARTRFAAVGCPFKQITGATCSFTTFRGPALALAGFRLAIMRRHRTGFPCCALFRIGMRPPTAPAKQVGPSSGSPDSSQPSPGPGRVGLRIVSFGAVSAFTHVAACRLAGGLPPPLSPRLRWLRYLRRRSDCCRLERPSCRAGFAPAENRRRSRRTWTSTRTHYTPKCDGATVHHFGYFAW